MTPMLQHNERDYELFLKCISTLKLHFCCCCYRKAVEDQLEYFLHHLTERQNTRSPNEVELVVPNETVMETATAPNENSMVPTPSQLYQPQKSGDVQYRMSTLHENDVIAMSSLTPASYTGRSENDNVPQKHSECGRIWFRNLFGILAAKTT